MLISIPKCELRKGMFVEMVDCPSHEFAKRRFVLKSDLDQAAIAASSAQSILINRRLGIDRKLSAPSTSTTMEGAPRADAFRLRKVRNEVDQSILDVNSTLHAVVNGLPPDVASLVSIAAAIDETWRSNPTIALDMTRMKKKDEATYVHSVAVGALMSLLGRSVGVKEEMATLLGVAGILHDIGKLLADQKILMKEGKLTDAEREAIQRHPEQGYQLLKAFPDVPQSVLDICRHHHEALDGSGYPGALTAEKLELHVRISTVCDVFEALTSARPYKRAWSRGEALNWMFARPELFDRKLVIRLGSMFV